MINLRKVRNNKSVIIFNNINLISSNFPFALLVNDSFNYSLIFAISFN